MVDVMGGAEHKVDSSGNSDGIKVPIFPITGDDPVPANEEKILAPEVKEKHDGPQKDTHAGSSTAAGNEKTDGPSTKDEETNASSSTTAAGKKTPDVVSSSTTAAGQEKTDIPPSTQKETDESCASTTAAGKKSSTSCPSDNKNESPPSMPAEKKYNCLPLGTTAVPENITPTRRNAPDNLTGGSEVNIDKNNKGINRSTLPESPVG